MIYLILVLILVGIDQITKHLIYLNMLENETIPVINNFLHITYVKNRGIAFGILQGKFNIISIITIIAIIGILYFVYNERDKLSYTEKIGFIFILSGAVGNMIDRGTIGYVIDMIDFRGIWVYVFNIADIWINIGVLLILFNLMKKIKKGV